MTIPDYTIFPLGDAALIIDFGNVIDEDINLRVLDIFRLLQKQELPGVTDLIPAYASLTIHYHPAALRQKPYPPGTSFQNMASEIKKLLSDPPALTEPQNVRKLRVPVCYSEPYSFDLALFAKEKSLPPAEIIRLHLSKSYRVYMVGFLPGFAYMGEVDDKLTIARKATPTPLVPAGSVGIAGRQTGIYPLNSPGGWYIIGRTPLKTFDHTAGDPVVFHPGDEVTFYSISADEFTDYQTRNA